MSPVPSPLHAMTDDRNLLLRCLAALDEERPAVERADLANWTALLAARYENVLADAFYPQMADSLGTRSEIERAGVRLQRAREAIGVVRSDLHGVAPIDAHAVDPDGIDANIDAMVSTLRELLRFEDAELFPLVEGLDPADTNALRQSVESASAHQTSLPDPPHNAVIRKLAEIKESVDLSLNDHSTSWHPGVDAVLRPSQ